MIPTLRPTSNALSLLTVMTTCTSTPNSPLASDFGTINLNAEKVVEKPQPNKPAYLSQEDINQTAPSLGLRLQDLPTEIQESVLDYLFGARVSTTSSSAASSPVLRGWSNVLRHPRRKQLSNLALVSMTWRQLIQERLYRHIKVKGTRSSLDECEEWFTLHPHLNSYVRHIEIWVPVWEKKLLQPSSQPPAHINPNHVQAHIITTTIVNATTTSFEQTNNVSLTFQLASQNATLEEILMSVKHLFPQACILTLEGGHCKKPPMVQHFRTQGTLPQAFPVMPTIRTLVLKGAWNIMRESPHFHTIAASFPNIREWHCTYAKPKSDAYTTIARVLHYIPNTLTHLNLTMESAHCKEASSPKMWRNIYPAIHICSDLGIIAPQLEALAYTGRICAGFFKQACLAAVHQRSAPKLKSLDLVVKNCCRPKSVVNDGTGITNWAFICSFEALVTAGVWSLDKLPDLNHLRIRFIDLDSAGSLMNPYFHLKHNRCTGLWNEEILSLLPRVRPGSQYTDLTDGLGAAGLDKDGHLLEASSPRRRPLAIKVGSYAAIADSPQL
ncbi:MAG: hypothetical protein M1835_006571 [Candelina submexicana]|nr:MAG: hypothetical protein M1835_006571 [Candelina submexicana]